MARQFITESYVKKYIKAKGKQVSKEYLDALDAKVRIIVDSSIVAANRFKRVMSDDVK